MVAPHFQGRPLVDGQVLMVEGTGKDAREFLAWPVDARKMLDLGSAQLASAEKASSKAAALEAERAEKQAKAEAAMKADAKSTT